MNLLQIEDLSVSFPSLYGEICAVSNSSLSLKPGEIRGIIGESGSGKSVLAQALLGLLDPSATINFDFYSFDDTIVTKSDYDVIRQGASIIFQDPSTSLNPSKTIGNQLWETLYLHHKDASRDFLKQESLKLLHDVGLSTPESLLRTYPHQFAAGVNQRIMIALAIACSPKLLVADEATTNLDMTIQSQILDLLSKLSREREMAVIAITHDFAILAETTDTTSVMYCGYILETGPTRDLLTHPRHPYTKALVSSIPQIGPLRKSRSHLYALKGNVPPAHKVPVGCPLGPRCPRAGKICVQLPKYQNEENRHYRCHYPLEDSLWEEHL